MLVIRIFLFGINILFSVLNSVTMSIFIWLLTEYTERLFIFILCFTVCVMIVNVFMLNTIALLRKQEVIVAIILSWILLVIYGFLAIYIVAIKHIIINNVYVQLTSDSLFVKPITCLNLTSCTTGQRIILSFILIYNFMFLAQFMLLCNIFCILQNRQQVFHISDIIAT
ncbi:hypothetical protein LCDV1gp031 [Lymphocystis disease virus 1]|uniref:hypothetical protein n=1 Tax=Fish lymphocystis disease virus TaxID=36363 RepID=UPI0000161EDD|nr:hypothetical protein LCDV1gp031 [Lymphocystis disease virus 1]